MIDDHWPMANLAYIAPFGVTNKPLELISAKGVMPAGLPPRSSTPLPSPPPLVPFFSSRFLDISSRYNSFWSIMITNLNSLITLSVSLGTQIAVERNLRVEKLGKRPFPRCSKYDIVAFLDSKVFRVV